MSAVPFADYLRAIPGKTGISAPQMLSSAPPVAKSAKSLAEGIGAIRAAADQARAQAMMPLENDTELAMADDGVNYRL